MGKFVVGSGGGWLVTQRLDDAEVINSCDSYEDAISRAEDLASQSHEHPVFVYKGMAVLEAAAPIIGVREL